MIAIAELLHAKIAAACPAIDGVRIGREDDRSTWAIIFKPDATADQRAAALGALDSFDPVKAQARADKQAALTASDADMARAGEDIFEALKAKGLIAESDLPAATQAKLAARRRLRAEIAGV